jgi:glycerophosphoryl diester phosphodiesterase
VNPQIILDQMYHGQTLIFGHRGASAYAPMNTLPAFELAAKQGADGVELDVHFSQDKQLIVLHDFTVDHTTDGTGDARDMTLAELKALDAGSWKGAEYTDIQIPTLDEVFEAIGQKLYVNVEIKSETEDTDGVEQAVADCIRRNNMQARVIVSSFNPLALKRFRDIMPAVPIGYLYMSDDQPFAEVMETLPHEARHPHYPMIDRAYMEWTKRKGYRVNAWTVDDPARAIELKRLGVDAIITDTPDVMREALHG